MDIFTKKKITLFIVLIALFFNSCKKNQDVTPDSPIQLGSLTLEPFKDLISKDISTVGSIIEVSNSTSKDAGLKIEIPDNTYAANNTVKISSSAILKHNFGENFNPISSLIRIEDNNTSKALKLINLTIPIKLPQGHFAAAFIYGEDGSLQIIPTISLQADKIIVSISQLNKITSFKNARVETGSGLNIIVTSVLQDKLDAVQFATDFVPGVDDWEFANYGTDYSPNGIVNGMTMGAYYYFYEVKPKNNKQLFGNDQLGKYLLPTTIGIDKDLLWMDNALGLSFASTLENQRAISKILPVDLYNPSSFNKIAFENNVYYNIAYNGLINPQQESQLLGIYGDTSNDYFSLIIIGKSKTGLIVADPNFPGIKRDVLFDKLKGFNNYQTGMLANKTKNYNRFAFIPSTIINKKEIKNYWDQVENKSIYPRNSFINEYVISTLNGSQVLTDGSSLFTNGNLIAITNKNDDENIDLSLIDNKGNKLAERTKIDAYALHNEKVRYYELPAGTNTLGVYRNRKNTLSGEYKWADFKWFSVNTEDFSISSTTDMPLIQQGQPDVEYTFRAGSGSYKPSADTQFEWNFGDGTPVVKLTANNEIKHTFKNGGSFSISLNVSTNSTKSNVTAKANIKSNVPTEGYFTISIPDIYGILSTADGSTDTSQIVAKKVTRTYKFPINASILDGQNSVAFSDKLGGYVLSPNSAGSGTNGYYATYVISKLNVGKVSILESHSNTNNFYNATFRACWGFEKS